MSSSAVLEKQEARRNKADGSWLFRVLSVLGISVAFFVLRTLLLQQQVNLQMERKPVVEAELSTAEETDAAAAATTAAAATKEKIAQMAAASVAARREEEEAFSGLYKPYAEKALEYYAGSWLATRERFLDSLEYIRVIRFLEGASFSIVGHGPKDPRITLMTRDFFDFQVLHLSSTTNQIPVHTSTEFFSTLTKQMHSTIKELRPGGKSGSSSSSSSRSSGRGGRSSSSGDVKHSTSRVRKAAAAAAAASGTEHLYEDPRLLDYTVALIPFSTASASVGGVEAGETQEMVDFQIKIRSLYFQATFWSVYRYMPHIVVTVSTKEDLVKVGELNLPIWRTVDMSALFNASVEIRKPGSPHFLPKETLLFIAGRLVDSSTETFSRFKYVFYTEGDHILHLRHAPNLLNVLDANKEFAIAPHRMQTISLPQAYPSSYHKQWSRQRVERLAHIKLITEDGFLSKGSCCDNGRFVFADCGNWWYNCPKWGLQNYTKWVRFGPEGFSLPLGTEHQARCTFSEERTLCPLPPKCSKRSPKNEQDVCLEIENREVGYKPPDGGAKKKHIARGE